MCQVVALMNTPKLVMLGPPGCGKGTQSKLLSEKYAIPHVSSGDILRDEAKKGKWQQIILETAMAEEIRNVIKTGGLVPERVMNEVVLGKIRSMEGYILDGYPRKIEQAEMLGEVGMAVFINVDRETCIQRICGRNEGRNDDNEEIGRRRYDVYRKETEPIIEYYKARGKLVEIYGCMECSAVFSEVCKAIERMN